MAMRIVNPNADDLGHAGFVFSAAEFDALLAFLEKSGIPENQIGMVRNCGFIGPIERNPGFEWLFQVCKVQADVRVLALCREGSLDAMKRYISFRFQEGTFPHTSE